jgi:predicted lipase
MVSNYLVGTFAYVGYNAAEDEIAVAFRGSHNIANWISNIDFTMTPYPAASGAQVHRGFLAAYKTLEDGMMRAISALKTRHPTAGIDVTGHSLGGSLATLAAAAIK